MERGFAVIGLGYVGLPVALALAKAFEPVIGFDISQRRIAALRNGEDATGEVTEAALRETRLAASPTMPMRWTRRALLSSRCRRRSMPSAAPTCRRSKAPAH